MTDRTPADALARARWDRELDPDHPWYVAWDDVPPRLRQEQVEFAEADIELLSAAGFQVTRKPDDNTRALAARLRDDAKRNEDVAVCMGELGAPCLRQATDLRAAAALLDGQTDDLARNEGRLMVSDNTPADVIAVGVCRRCNQSGELVNHGAVCRPCADGEGWVRRTFTVWIDERAFGSSPDDDEIAYTLRMGGMDAETMQEHGDEAAAGYRVSPIPDDNTRALAARLREHADFGDPDDIIGKDMLTAADLLDGQPQDRPATCPTCGSDNPRIAGGRRTEPCPDPWHNIRSGVTSRTPSAT